MLDSTGHLAVALLALYALYTPLAFYILIKHGKHGLLGWIYIIAFSTLRVAGSVITIADENSHQASSGASIINSVALSPLILATFGIQHEANRTIRGSRPLFLGWPLQIAVHLISYGAIGLAAAGGSSLTSGNRNSQAAGLLKGGVIIFVTIWLLLVAVTLQSFKYNRAMRESQWLLYSVMAALPFLGIRVSYSLISAFATSKSLNPVTGSIVIKVVLGALPELVIVTLFIFAGILTRKISSNKNVGTVRVGSASTREEAPEEPAAGMFAMSRTRKSFPGRH